MRENRTRLQLWMLAPLMLLAAGCTSRPVSLPPQPAAIPDLPSEARQPPAPQWCSPNCSSGLTRERGSWQQRMTEPE